MKLNKSIKTHIADMAIRKKYKEEYDARLEELSRKCYKALRKENHNSDFDSLPDRAKRFIRKSDRVSVTPEIRMCKTWDGGKYSRAVQGLSLAAALQTYPNIGELVRPDKVYGNDYRFNMPDKLSEDMKTFRAWLKGVSNDRVTLLSAMDCYRTAHKMFAELPWTEEFYPEEHKKTKTNLIPVSTIAAANELMGVK